MPRINMNMLDQRAVDVQTLASNFIDIISDCEGLEDFSLRNELQNRYPLATWLSGTRFSRTLRQRSTNPQMFHKGGEDAEWVMAVMTAVGLCLTLQSAAPTYHSRWYA